MMFACYRKDEANEPETYCAAVAAVLGDGYSRQIVEYVTDPRTGLPSRQKFLPNIAEIREACDARAAHVERIERYSHLKPVAPSPVEHRPGWIDASQFDARVTKGELNQRPIGRFEKDGYEAGPRGAASQRDVAQTLKKIEEANRRIFEDECRREGLMPHEQMASPSLRRVLTEQGWARETIEYELGEGTNV